MKKLFILIFIAFVAFSCSSQGPKPNEIWYTSSNGDVVIPTSSDVFKANIVSNIYENGKGIIKFDNDVTLIGSSAFDGCTSLTSVTIPDSVTSIGDYAFRGCTSLASITIPDSVKGIGWSAFNGCTSLLSVDLPDNLTWIRNFAFYKCTSLTSITLPDNSGVRTGVGSWVFDGCTSLTSVTIPDSVTTIYYQFSDCTSLKEVYCKPTTPPAGSSSMFSPNATELKIYVPRNSVKAYKSASGWKDYASYIVGYDF